MLPTSSCCVVFDVVCQCYQCCQYQVTILFLVCLQDGGTPLFVACQCNHQDVVEELLNHGADIHSQMIDGATSLFITAQNGHFKLLKYLISQGADVNLRRKVRNIVHLKMCSLGKLAL